MFVWPTLNYCRIDGIELYITTDKLYLCEYILGILIYMHCEFHSLHMKSHFYLILMFKKLFKNKIVQPKSILSKIDFGCTILS